MDNSSDFCNWFSGLEKKEQKEIRNIVKDGLVKSGKYETWRNCMFAENSKHISEIYGTEFIKKYEIYLGVENSLNFFEEKCCKQIYDSSRARNKRLKDKLTYNLQNFDCVFLTLTFTNEVLENTSHLTRRVYIQRFLKSIGCSFFVANIDYGDKDKNPESKEREHYHAIVNTNYVDLSSYSYGFIFAEKVKKSSFAITLAKYVNKLTCHAYKDSTKGRDRLIYSR